MKNPLLLEECRHYRRKRMRDVELTISTRSKTFVIVESVHSTRTAALSEGKQDERTHFKTGNVPGVDVNMSRFKHGRGDTS